MPPRDVPDDRPPRSPRPRWTCEGRPAMQSKTAPARDAAALCGAFVRCAGDLAALAEGAPIGPAALQGVALIATLAADILAAAPLSPWWQGRLEDLPGDAGPLFGAWIAATNGTLSPDIPAAGHGAALDIAAIERGALAALAVGLQNAADDYGVAAPADAAPS